VKITYCYLCRAKVLQSELLSAKVSREDGSEAVA
jgi:hypothetical protein